ncbi:MAG: 50S ribosomal protein L4 [Rhodothermales bacterium]|nr:50S ribosomal protein L4 [Rhodothermales bacterium]MCA0269353.1 50S ribosomal protein L4 [Bacteroidota bacterium]
MELKVYRGDGTATDRTVALDASVFGIEPNDHAIWLDVKALQANARQGTHKAKERGENAHSTRKLYRQKGTGGARAGSAKSPTRKGGGTIFGPRPRDYRQFVNKKTKQLARRSALSYKAQEDGAIRLVDSFTSETPSTKTFASLLKGMDVLGRRVLILTDGYAPTVVRSVRNLDRVAIRPAAEASTLDIMQAHVVVLAEGALGALSQTLGTQKA